MPPTLHRPRSGAPVTRLVLVIVAIVLLVSGSVACGGTARPETGPEAGPEAVHPPVPSASRTIPAVPSAPMPPPPPSPHAASGWQVGARPLPLRPDGFGAVLPTPAALVERALPTIDRLAPPTRDAFEPTVSRVPADVLARSTWQPACPVRPDELRYLTMSFHGFDGRVHTGEMLVHADVAQTVVGVFATLFAARFPIEEMRVVDAAELSLPPTGDGNNTSAFVCRPARGQTRWSAHASGLAIDLNPFHNPYHHADLVLPELASAYLERDRVRPGMVLDGGPAVTAFEAAGWTWGGRWSEPGDLMHFSATGD